LVIHLETDSFNGLKRRNNKLPKKRTELAVLTVTPKGFKLLERTPGVSLERIIASTEAELIIEGEIPEMQI
jgi:acyl CoA:acetate/3-ketoacid CoA transferase beta subunit